MRLMLNELEKVVCTLIPQLPEEKQEETAGNLELAVKAATAPTPHRKWWSVSSDGLLEAADFVKEFSGKIAGTVGRWRRCFSRRISGAAVARNRRGHGTHGGGGKWRAAEGRLSPSVLFPSVVFSPASAAVAQPLSLSRRRWHTVRTASGGPHGCRCRRRGASSARISRWWSCGLRRGVRWRWGPPPR